MRIKSIIVVRMVHFLQQTLVVLSAGQIILIRDVCVCREIWCSKRKDKNRNSLELLPGITVPYFQLSSLIWGWSQRCSDRT